MNFLNKFRLASFALATLLILASCSDDSDSDPMDDEQGQDPTDDPIDTSARAVAKALYQDFYLPSVTSGDNPWTGNESNCDPGTIPDGTKEKIFMRIHYYRNATGLNNTLTENDAQSAKAQEAALMMQANNTLDHFPPNSWSCYTAGGDEAAGKSNLAFSKNAEAIDLYMRDPGSNNGPVGHRRWLLYPRLETIGLGNTNEASAIWVVGNSGATPSDAPDFVSWPPKGYTPDRLVYPRWSFSIAGANFSETEIDMKDQNGNSISFDTEEIVNGFGDNTLVWVPNGINNNVTEDTAYTVTLTNVNVGGTMTTYEYDVILFDPEN